MDAINGDKLKVLKTTVVWLNRLVWTALVTVLVLIAVYVSLGRYYVRYVHEYQSVLLERLVDYTGLPLSVEKLYGKWSKLAPVFTMDQVELRAPHSDRSVLSIKKVSFQIDPLQTLLHRSLHIKKLIVNGVQCTLQEARPGHWQLKGYPVESGKQDFNTIVDLVLSVDGAELSGANLKLDFFKGKDALLKVQELSLRRKDNFRRLRLMAKVDKSDRPLISVIEARGDPRDQDDFSAKAYLKLDDIDFSAQLPAIRALGIDLREAKFDSEIWINWQPGTRVTAQGHISTPFLDIAALSGERLQPLKDLALSFRVEKAADKWKVWVPSFKTQWQGEQLLFDHMVMEVAGNRASLAIPKLSVDQTIKHLLLVHLLAAPERELIEALSPQGYLKNIHLTLNNPASVNSSAVGQPRFLLRANLSNVSVEPWHDTPGSKGISGYVEAEPLSGLVDLDARNMTLNLPHIYHHSLLFDSALGQIRWTIDQYRVKIRSGPLQVRGKHGPASGLFSLNLPLKDGTGTPTMDLSIGLRDTDASYRTLFLPYTLSPNLLDWLSKSLISGHVIEGGFIYRGSLLKADHLNRTVQLFFNVDHTSLDYHPDWPPLKDINGLVIIDDGDVRVDADSAKMLSMDVNSTRVTVNHSDDGMWLQVDGSASGQASDALKIINSSMINRMVDGAFQNWALTGQTTASVKLGIPLEESQRAPDIDVNVRLDNGHLSIPEHRIQLDGINGPIRYTSRYGISSPGLDATLYGRPLRSTIRQDRTGGISIDMDGHIDMKDVAQWSHQPMMGFVTGDTSFKARIFIAPKAEGKNKPGRHSELLVSSNLRGVAVDLPAPYGKASGQEKSFRLQQSLSGAPNQLTMDYGDLARLQLQFERGNVAGGQVILGRAKKVRRLPGKFVVEGDVGLFKLDQWRPVLQRYLDRQKALAGHQSPALALAIRDLKVDTFEGFSQRFDDNTVNLQQRRDGWRISVENPQFDGALFIPTDRRTGVSVRLDRLQLPADALSKKPDNKGLLSSISLKNLKRFDAYVAIANLIVGQERYGSLDFELHTQPGELELKNLGGFIRGVRIGTKGPALLRWWSEKHRQRSRLSGDFDFSDLGDVLHEWHYERFIESDYGSGSLDLSWPGRPDQFSLASSTGPLSIDLRRGRFLKASSTASGTLKVVGIVNLMNVVRRLRLDFSDLFKKGISYDEVRGAAKIENRQLEITNGVEVKSPSTQFHLRGKADLATSQLDMELVATLPVASNLPWIAALAGGLPVAAGVYLASKIFEDQVDRLSSAVYTVTGDWNNPTLKFERVFDNTPKKSSSASAAGTAHSEHPATRGGK